MMSNIHVFADGNTLFFIDIFTWLCKLKELGQFDWLPNILSVVDTLGFHGEELSQYAKDMVDSLQEECVMFGMGCGLLQIPGILHSGDIPGLFVTFFPFIL